MWLPTLLKEQQEVFLGLAHNVVVSDGLLDPNEEGMLEEFRQEMGLSSQFESSYTELEGIEEIFNTKRSRLIALLNLLRLSYADGAFEIEEECFLREVSKAFRISDQEFLLVDNWVRRMQALEEEARGFLTV
ncbi:MAG: hypothetical protein CMD74_03715 [Gammaproteobacteria bacterium]|nr:hypothetical protein [Gammaproteobacteria bacterium]